MKLLSILALLLAVSCSSKSTTCKANTDCSSATETCQSGTCQAETASNCRTNAPCSADNKSCLNGACAFRRSFVTSSAFAPGKTGTNGFQSVADADIACKNAATQANLGGTWMAWIKDSTQTSIASRFISNSHIPANDSADVYDVNGKNKISGPFVWNGDTAKPTIGSCGGFILASPAPTGCTTNEHSSGLFFETGKTAGAQAFWTGADTQNPPRDCKKWTSKENADRGIYGQANLTASGWDAYGSPTVGCDDSTSVSLLCLEVNQ